jgi:hypothetical protein
MSRVRRRLSRELVARQPYERWNAFIDLVATEDATSLTVTQRAAQLAFWYDSEVQNGGHLQYFENEAGRQADATIQALRTMGASCQADILAAAVREWSAVERQPSVTAEEYVENALEGEFDDFDAQYAACVPSITELLERYLDQYESEFIDYTAG